MTRTVLITTSGTGSRLGSLTKYTNKSLVKVGDKYAICRILESHPEDTRFIITLGYYGNLVKDFLTIAYPNKNFEFIDVDIYEGYGSSLIYSMRKAKEKLMNPFYFHCCDTLLDEKIPDLSSNTLFVSKGNDSQTYSTITASGGKVVAMNPKGAATFDFIYLGVSYIQDVAKFWEAVESIYQIAPYDQSLSDIHAIIHLIKKGLFFHYKEIEKCFDTGNLLSYRKANEYFKGLHEVLEKENESLCFLGDRVIKFINDPVVNEKRYIRGKLLYPMAPEILEKSSNFLCMRYISGELLADVKNYGEVYSLLEWAQKNLWKNKKTSTDFRECCRTFYKDKTLQRIEDLKLQEKEKVVVNGISTGRIQEILESLDFDFLYTDTFSFFHGDFILDNILKVDNTYCLLDWRHEFGNQIEYGDTYYDLAKLRHNIIFNHKNISDGLFSYTSKGEEVFVDIKCNYLLIQQLEEFERFCRENGYNIYKIRILTSLIWLNMASLYESPLQEFLFYFGKYNLILSISHKNLQDV